jgi:hypothetical protein
VNDKVNSSRLPRPNSSRCRSATFSRWRLGVSQVHRCKNAMCLVALAAGVVAYVRAISAALDAEISPETKTLIYENSIYPLQQRVNTNLIALPSLLHLFTTAVLSTRGDVFSWHSMRNSATRGTTVRACMLQVRRSVLRAATSTAHGAPAGWIRRTRMCRPWLKNSESIWKVSSFLPHTPTSAASNTFTTPTP